MTLQSSLYCPNRRSGLRTFGLILCPLLFFVMMFCFDNTTVQAADPIFVDSGQVLGTTDTHDVALGDLDGDGDLDAVTAEGWPDHSQLWRNDAGVFTPVGLLTQTIDSTYAVALGDLDSDGDLDIVLGSGGKNRIYENDGDFVFKQPIEIIDGATRAVALNDLNGDGLLDIVFGNYSTTGSGVANADTIYQNQGNLIFTKVGQLGEVNTYDLALGDLNGDQLPDIFVAGDGDDAVWQNQGNFQFVKVTTVGKGRTYAVTLGDVDGDGDLDAVTGKPGTNYLWRNDGNFVFSPTAALGELDSRQVALGDLDRDGDLDVFIANSSGSSINQPNLIFRNDGTTFTEIARLGGANSYSVALGDVDNDGDLDAFVGNVSGQGNQVWLGDGGGILHPLAALPIGDTPHALGDLDSDGDLDLFSGRNPTLALGGSANAHLVYRYDDTEKFVPVQLFGDAQCEAVALGDLDGDGDLDAFVANNGPNTIWRNDGDFIFVRVATLGNLTSKDVALGDLDGDGDLDVYVANTGSFFAGRPDTVWRNDGNFVFTQMATLGEDDQAPGGADPGTFDSRAVALGDLDQDGDLDAFVGIGSDRPNLVWRNDGDFRFTEAAKVGSSESWSVGLGDLDGDGDLDAYVANHFGQADRFWQNDGAMNFVAVQDLSELWGLATALGDLDGDGDLDAVTSDDRGYALWLNRGDGELRLAEQGQDLGYAEYGDVSLGDFDGDGDLDAVVRGMLLENRTAIPTQLAVTLNDPNPTAKANFFASPHILRQPIIPLAYSLFHPTDTTLMRIEVYYSLNGGGSWQPATPTTDTQTTSLMASPTGATHHFYWQAVDNLIKGDRVAVRIEAYPMLTNATEPFQQAIASSTVEWLRIEAPPWFAKIVDQNNMPIAGAIVYADGKVVAEFDGTPRRSSRAGLVKLGDAMIGQPLVAMSQQAEQATVRHHHDGWGYRTWITSMGLDEHGEAEPYYVSTTGEQRLQLDPHSPQIHFNLVISVEWDAGQEYLEMLARALQSANHYLYDLSDGQMLIGQTAIYDNAQAWSNADIQISARNNLRPHAFIGGINAENPANLTRLGRGWNRYGDHTKLWDQPDGYRTIIHELGHYALYLYDEYLVYIVNDKGEFDGTAYSGCTEPWGLPASDDRTMASAMSSQYKSTEFSAKDVDGLWTPLCMQTLQWQMTKLVYMQSESTWETITRMYSDHVQPPRWQLTSPITRGTILTGPLFPAVALSLPVTTIHNNARPTEVSYDLTMLGAEGTGIADMIISLQTEGGRTIGQGMTDIDGQITVVGANAGDTILANTIDLRQKDEFVLGNTLQITRSVISSPTTTAATATQFPHVRLVPLPVPGDAARVDLMITAHDFDAPLTPGTRNVFVFVTAPDATSAEAPLLQYSPATGLYQGQVNLSAMQNGMGQLQTLGAAGGQLVNIPAEYRLHPTDNLSPVDLFSGDGRLTLALMPRSLPGDQTTTAITQLGGLPAALPAQMQTVGHVYDLIATGGVIELAQPAVLQMAYTAGVVERTVLTPTMQIYHWHDNQQQWQPVATTIHTQEQMLSAGITELGIYAILAEAKELSRTPSSDIIFLPIIQNP